MTDKEKIDLIEKTIDDIFEWDWFGILEHCQSAICTIANVINQKGEENDEEKES